ncbi:hypothetical protein CHU98_g11580 [Xylaria longipes]|nr:hypothetical protein CHU98_g11580 [Xylaria longipes]
MVTLFPSKDAPSSPWATRFPLEDHTFTSLNTNHSVLAPAVPRINDPKYYDLDPVLPPNHPPLTPADLDQLFSTEAAQTRRLKGIKTWEVAALNRYVRFSLGYSYLSAGHSPIDAERSLPFSRFSVPEPSRPSPIIEALLNTMETNEERDFAVYLRERIQVDETLWFPFLRKSRWFDWIQVSQDFNSPAGKTWSVDDPKVWEALRISLELVNRMLAALIDDKHEGDYWENFVDIFGPEPHEGDSILLSYNFEKMISQRRGIKCQYDFVPNMTPQNWSDRLVSLLSDLIWGFREHPTVNAACHTLPIIDSQSTYGAMIAITISKLELMLSSEITLGELCMAQVDLALLIVHELMHATVNSRYRDDNYVGNCLDKNRTGYYAAESEPIMIADFPIASSGGKLIPPLTLAIRQFPFPGCTESERRAPNCPSLDPGALVTTIHVPSLWASMMLAESFWRDTQSLQKSANFFHRSSRFVSSTPINTAMREVAEVQVRIPPDQQYNSRDDKLVVEEWVERQTLWERYRQGWYDDAKQRWRESPWRPIEYRWACDQFAAAFEKRDLVNCTNIAFQLVTAVRWDRGRATFERDLPLNGRKTFYWAWHAIGLLMMASIPRLHTPVWRGLTQLHNAWFAELTPSMAATAAGFNRTAYIPHAHIGDERIDAAPLKFYDHLRGKGEVQDYVQTDCLSLIDDMLNHIMHNKGIVHQRMLDAIVAAKNAIYVDRRRIEVSYPDPFAHSSKWTPTWVFKFPSYDETCCAFGPDGTMDLVH